MFYEILLLSAISQLEIYLNSYLIIFLYFFKLFNFP